MKKISFLLSLLLLSSFSVEAQVAYPKGYFRSPVDIPIFLAGNFGELRNNHFHGGLDIKTESVEGKNIYAIADGYVSRIKIAHGGYGKVIYINHPNGYTSTYAHLQKLTGKLDEYLKKHQYEKETYEIELFPSDTDLVVKKGDIIALSGNTGASGGPHLHFEIRDTKTEKAINPLLFGFDIKDEIKPTINAISIYPLNDSSHVNNSHKEKYFTVSGSNGKFYLNSVITANGKIGFGVAVTDYLNGSANKCGVFSIELLIDSQTIYSHNIEKIGFDETRYINSLVDYKHAVSTGNRYQKSFLDPNNKLGIYDCLQDAGICRFTDNKRHHIKYIVKDSYQNTSELEFFVQSSPERVINSEKKKGDLSFNHKKPNTFKNDEIMVKFPSHVFYTDIDFEYKKSEGIKGSLTPVHHIHNAYTPLHAHAILTIKVDSTKLHPKYKNKAVVVALTEDKKFKSAEGGEWENWKISVKTKNLGPYTVMVDTIPPSIRAHNIVEGRNMKNYPNIVYKISDGLSGIKSFKAHIDGKFALMEYEYKNQSLTYTFDESRLTHGNHTLELTVTDERGNSATKKVNFVW